MSKVRYIGFEVGVRPDATEILGDPAKPGNWKQETYEAKLPEMREKQLAKADNDLRAGLVKDIVLIDPDTGIATKAEDLSGMEDTYIVGFSPRFRLQQAAWGGGDTPPWIWYDGVNGVEIVDLYRASGAKSDGMKLEEMINFWLPEGEKADCPAEAEARAAMAIADKLGLTDPNVLHYSQ